MNDGEENKKTSQLPISEHKAEILKALSENQVVIVCGDTGSGKTTQLPQMALELGRGSNGRRIACTQPRRLAAVTVARRVAEERGEEVGATVGYQHRFERKVTDATRIKFMTDGVLLAETRNDPLLRAYDTIIIDEAHERSLNIDFLLGILKRILSKRRDLKVVVSSATLDAGLFSDFFDGAPALMIPGRLYPIALRYQPPEDGEETDLARDVARAVDTLPPEGDILVFLPGERDIRECAEALAGRPGGDGDEIIPLIASLPASEQQRAFRLSRTKRRIVLATNVAETSVTIPGVSAVIDSGLARISRYIHRTQVQRLQIEPVSQASAKQRAGRCGRLGPGTCIRLYSEEDFLGRDKYTAPEILRSSLAGVILTMLDLRLGDIAEFPFVTRPENNMITEGMRELGELGAIGIDREGMPALTPIGRKLAAMPVEPRIGRIIIAADKEAVLPSALPVAAFMACDDPRRRPVEDKEKADQAHAKFKAQGSDFASVLKMWRWWEKETEGASQNQARKLCKANYLSFAKMREWRDLAAQLKTLAKRLGLDVAQDTGGDDGLHRALLAGLLGRIGKYNAENREYRGARGIKFFPFPGSALFKHPPEWIMAGELVDTSRLYAREAAVLNPEWIEPVAGPLCKHSYNSPEWDRQNGFVRATEQVTLYGIVIVEARRCDYSRVNPAESRDIFIRRGLIDCAVQNPPGPLKANFALLTALRQKSEKLRRPEFFDEEALAAFFDAAIPAGICSAGALRKWLWKASSREISAFKLKPEDWMPPDDEAKSDFPDAITIGGVRMALSYRNSLDDDEDGITCTARASTAAALRNWRSDWLVPGAIREKLAWMIACLPSAQRRILSPVEDVVARLMTYLHPGEEPLAEALSTVFNREWGVRIQPEAWDGIRMPAHFSVRYRIVDDKTRRVLAVGRDLEAVLAKAGVTDAAPKADAAPGKAKGDERHTTWAFGNLPAETTAGEAGWQIRQYPALRDEGDGVSLTSFSSPDQAKASHAAGVTRLYVLAQGTKAKAAVKFRQWPMQAAYFLKRIGYDSAKMADDLLFAAAAEAYVRDQPEIRTRADFEARLGDGQLKLAEARAELLELVFDTVTAAAEYCCETETESRLAPETAAAIRNQIDWLVFPGFIRLIPLVRMRNYRRYLEAVRIRIGRAKLSPSADASREESVAAYWTRYRTAIGSKELRHFNMKALVDYRWMIEEYRVSLFAQELRTPAPVSPKRLDAKWAEASRQHL